MSGVTDLTTLLAAANSGNAVALDRVTQVVYAELKRIARLQMRGERHRNTLQTTALVHEAYLRLAGSERLRFQDGNEFFGLVARIMRRILTDAARARRTLKRGGDRIGPDSLDFEALADPVARKIEDVLALDRALTDLARLDARKAQVVEMRFFGGLTVEETAQVLDLSVQSVLRDWRLAKAWLIRELGV